MSYTNLPGEPYPRPPRHPPPLPYIRDSRPHYLAHPPPAPLPSSHPLPHPPGARFSHHAPPHSVHPPPAPIVCTQHPPPSASHTAPYACHDIGTMPSDVTMTQSGTRSVSSRSVAAPPMPVTVPPCAPGSHALYGAATPAHIRCQFSYQQPPPPHPRPHPQLKTQPQPISQPHVVHGLPVASHSQHVPSAHPAHPALSLSSQSPACGAKAFVGSLSKDEFVEAASQLLDRTAAMNDNTFPLPLYSEPESVFFSVVKPEIPTKEYMKRLVTYTHCSPAAFILMLVYLERVANANKKLVVTPYNMHRLLITALTLACKNLDDQCFANAHYAKVGGIPTVREMNRLELQFLKYLKYVLFVKREEHDRKIAQLFSVESDSPKSIHESSLAPHPGAARLSHDGKGMAVGPRAYITAAGLRSGGGKISGGTDGRRYAEGGSEAYDRCLRNSGGMMPPIHNSAQRRPACSAKRFGAVAVNAMEVCRTAAGGEATHAPLASGRDACRP